MKHILLAATAGAAVAMTGLPPARAQAPGRPAGSCAAITRAAGRSYHAALADGRAAAADRAVREDDLAARADQVSQRQLNRFYAAVARGLAGHCYLLAPAAGFARR
jgi:ABC-type sugar transport system substrate-binding protein